MLTDLNHETVDMIPNYDGRHLEPTVLPSRFPNLLVNGSDGIAVGMATDIPPHNLREVCDAAVLLIDDPQATVLDLMELLPGPDFPTGGIICGRQGILDAYSTGRGKITLRACAEINEEGARSQIIITEVPYQQTRIRLAEAMGELVKDERIKGVHDIKDESSQRTGRAGAARGLSQAGRRPALRPEPAVRPVAVAEDGEPYPCWPWWTAGRATCPSRRCSSSSCATASR